MLDGWKVSPWRLVLIVPSAASEYQRLSHPIVGLARAARNTGLRCKPPDAKYTCILHAMMEPG